jgi:hypothetical protein
MREGGAGAGKCVQVHAVQGTDLEKPRRGRPASGMAAGIAGGGAAPASEHKLRGEPQLQARNTCWRSRVWNRALEISSPLLSVRPAEVHMSATHAGLVVCTTLSTSLIHALSRWDVVLRAATPHLQPHARSGRPVVRLSARGSACAEPQVAWPSETKYLTYRAGHVCGRAESQC